MRAKAPSCSRCGRYRQPPCRQATDVERLLARIALVELARERLAIVLVPAPVPRFVGHKIRVVAQHNPERYRVLAHRRPIGCTRRGPHGKGLGGKHSIRGYVVRALRDIVAGCVVRRSIGEEVLAELVDANDEEKT